MAANVRWCRAVGGDALPRGSEHRSVDLGEPVDVDPLLLFFLQRVVEALREDDLRDIADWSLRHFDQQAMSGRL